MRNSSSYSSLLWRFRVFGRYPAQGDKTSAIRDLILPQTTKPLEDEFIYQSEKAVHSSPPRLVSVALCPRSGVNRRAQPKGVSNASGLEFGDHPWARNALVAAATGSGDLPRLAMSREVTRQRDRKDVDYDNVTRCDWRGAGSTRTFAGPRNPLNPL
jgi:hypothetical protein